MTQQNHRIDADDRNIFDVLNEQKYTVDYFQREYSWEKKHIEQLVSDLTTAFLDVFNEKDPRTAVENYNNYYLGPFVISNKDGARSIIDGQQRLTSLTLFLIFLNNLQKEIGTKETIEPLIFSEKYGQKSFNIQVEERKACLDRLFIEGSYETQPNDNESTINMAERYANIEKAFPEELKGHAFPYFLDWIKYNVILVEITAYSEDNAYTIFESMNDRGLNLTYTEMLKGFILSRFKVVNERERANDFWKQSIQTLHTYSKEEDLKFFQAWLRSQYADTIRQGKAGSSNEDFEKIGTRFHDWFRGNLGKAGLQAESSTEFDNFLYREMRFFLRAYLNILDAQKKELNGWEHVFYHYNWGIAESLALPLMLAPLISSDSPDIVREKINEVAKYMETFAVLRSINFKKFGASSIRYTMYSLVKEIRGKDIDSLRILLKNKLSEMPETWEGISKFQMHGMNRYFIKFFLSRVTGFIEQKSGLTTNFSSYFVNRPGNKPYQVEHIWANKFDDQNEFDQKHLFENYRNRIGALVLLPQGTNQSYGAISYPVKLKHYLKENLFVKSLHPETYERNPNFKEMFKSLNLPFKPHEVFTKNDIDERQDLVMYICKVIWG